MRYMKKGTVTRPLFVCDETGDMRGGFDIQQILLPQDLRGWHMAGDALCHEAWEAKLTSLKGTGIRPLFVSE